MGLELLARQVALSLDQLAVRRIDAEQLVHPAFDREHERVGRIEVGGVGAAMPARIVGAVGNTRPGIVVDHRHEPPAFELIEELRHDPQLGPFDSYRLDRLVGGEALADLLADPAKAFPVGIVRPGCDGRDGHVTATAGSGTTW